MSDRARKMPTRRPERAGRTPEADPVAARLDRIEAVLANLSPEPTPVGEEFIVGQLEQAKLIHEAIGQTIGNLETQLAELRQGDGGEADDFRRRV